ncbi:MAG TPA: hypothetical protein VGM44_18465 [Polyangiaceae bacterium]|jgi:hypothetical protein
MTFRLHARSLFGFSIALFTACGSSGGAAPSGAAGSANTAGNVGASGSAGSGVSSGGNAGASSSAGSGGASGASGGGTSSAGNGGNAGSGTAGTGGTPTSAIGSGAPLDPHLIGINYWGESDTEALWPTVQASGVKLIRFGGAGADKEQPTNQRFADVATAIRKIGAEPYLQVSRFFDATRAKQLVDFVNNQQALHVVYWSINNEPDIDANEDLMSVSDTANLIMTLGSAMKEADPTIQIFAPETAYYHVEYLGPMLGGANDITGKDANGNYYIDGVSFHAYPFGANYTRDQAVGAAAGIGGSVTQLLAAMNSANQKNGRTGSHALKWGLTEFNMTYNNPGDNSVGSFGVNSFLNGQFFAEVFGVGMANSAVTMDPWSIHESNGDEGLTDLGYLDGPVNSAKPRSSYYHLQFLAQNFTGRFAPAKSTQPLLRAVAAGDGTRVSVLLLNESTDQNYEFGVRLDNGQLMQAKAVTVDIDAALAAEYSSTIPAQSSMLLLFDNTGKVTKRMDYAIADAQAHTAPRMVNP